MAIDPDKRNEFVGKAVGDLGATLGAALGAQAGEARMREVMQKAGFTRFRRATQTPFNLVYEIRP
jgi:hypothetical protein